MSHKKPNNRVSWVYNGEEGWYVGPRKEHYRCVKFYFIASRATQKIDTVTFFQKDNSMPQAKLYDFLRQEASDIPTILTDPPSTTAFKNLSW